MCKTHFDSSATLIANDPDIHEAFGSLHQSAMTKKKKKIDSEDWIVKTNVEYSIKAF